MGAAYNIHAEVNLVTMQCGKCGISFAMPDFKQRECLETGENFYCPNGHPRVYRETESDRLRKKLEEQTREATRQADRALQAQRERDEAIALRAKAERKLKRVAKGTCPDCNRTFQNLARHMACKHSKPLPAQDSSGAKP